jgi:hypothetical protein
MDIRKTAKSKGVKLAAFIIGVILIAIIIFAAGVSVGFHKARYSYQWGENYERNFAGPPRGMGSFGDHDNFRNPNGLAGTIISVTNNNLVVKAVTDKTIIKDGPNDIKIGDLKTDERIVVLGKPGDNGVVNADFIRVFNNNDTNNPPADNSVNNNNSTNNNNSDSNNTNNQNN